MKKIIALSLLGVVLGFAAGGEARARSTCACGNPRPGSECRPGATCCTSSGHISCPRNGVCPK